MEALEIQKYFDALKLSPEGVVILSQLAEAVEKGMVSKSEALNYLSHAERDWRKRLADAKMAPPAAVMAVRSARAAAGHRHGFPGRQPIERQALGATRYVTQSFSTLRAYHFKLEPLMSEEAISLEGCRPAEFSESVASLFEKVQEHATAGKPIVRPGATIGSPTGVVWSTHVVADLPEGPSTHAAGTLRDIFGLCDSGWDDERGLFQYSIDADQLGQCYRPTPVEGGNRRFRLQPFGGNQFEPFGATVHLRLLLESLRDGGHMTDDGVPEAVSKPISPDAELWRDLVRDLVFSGALPSPEDQTPEVNEDDFQDRILRGKGLTEERMRQCRELFWPEASPNNKAEDQSNGGGIRT